MDINSYRGNFSLRFGRMGVMLHIKFILENKSQHAHNPKSNALLVTVIIH